MANDINEVTLLGNMGDAPEVKEFENGKKVANISIATNKSWKDKSTGEWTDVTEWHRVVVFDQNIIGWLERDAVKGTRVWLRGELKTRSYEKGGEKHYVTEVILNPFVSSLKFQGRTKRELANEVGKEQLAQEPAEDEIPF